MTNIINVFCHGRISSAGILLSMCLFIHMGAEAAETRLINLTAEGIVPERASILGNSISKDGRFVAFASNQPYTGLPPKLGTDIYVRDLATGLVELVSVNSDGEQGNQGSLTPSISEDGQVIVFSSFSTNLVDDDTNNLVDLFLHNRMTGETIRINEGPNGEQTSSTSSRPVLSGNGNLVAFESNAKEILDLESNSRNVYIYEVDSGDISSPNFDAEGNRRSGALGFASPSDDGSEIVLNSRTSFDPRHTGSSSQIYVYNRNSDVFELISFGTSDQAATFVNNPSAISGDGRHVAFMSFSQLVPEDSDNRADIMVRDRIANELWIATITDQGEQTSAQPFNNTIALSDDGQSVLFSTSATEFSMLDTDNQADVYLYDRALDKSELISQNSLGEAADMAVSNNFAVADNGRYAIFESTSTNLDPSATEGGFTNLFRRDRGADCGSADMPLTVSLLSDFWYQLSVPCEAPANANTLQDILADDIAGEYEDTWITYVYETIEGVAQYRIIELDEPLTPSQGFWFAHIEEQSVTLDMPTGSRGISTNFDGRDACVSVVGCHPLPLSGDSLEGVRWNMVGNPFPDPEGLMFDDIRVTTNAGECSTDVGCSLLQAADVNVTGDSVFSWTGLDYSSFSSGTVIPVWFSGWLAEAQSDFVLDTVLHLPE